MMTNVHPEMVEQPLIELLRETAQAHFLHALAADEALAVLHERRERLLCLLQLKSGQEQHPGSALLMDHFQLRLLAEMAWVERAITALQRSDRRPGQSVENVGDVERSGS